MAECVPDQDGNLQENCQQQCVNKSELQGWHVSADCVNVYTNNRWY